MIHRWSIRLAIHASVGLTAVALGAAPHPQSKAKQPASPATASPGEDPAAPPFEDGNAPREGEPGERTPYPAVTDEPDLGAEDRPVPDYDGRPEPTTAGDVLIWVPRVALAPAYLVSEYVVRRPLGWLTTTAEQNNWPTLIADFFTFGKEKRVGVVPTALIDFGFQTSVGLYMFWDEFLAENNSLRARVATGGLDWLEASLANRVRVSRHETIALRGFFSRRPDWVFHGFGPSSGSREADYGRDTIEGAFKYNRRLWRSSRFHSQMGVRHSTFDASPDRDEQQVSEAIAAGRYPEPPGFADGYTIAFTTMRASVDTRMRRRLEDPHEGSDFLEPPGSGLRLQGRGELASDLSPANPTTPGGSERQAWLRWGATLGGYFDLNDRQRVVGLSLISDFVTPVIGDSDIPLPEQVVLGGFRPMRGFLQGRLVDKSSIVARFEYRYPVWVWLDGELTYEIGNVFGRALSGFETKLLRNSFGFGFRTLGARDHAFELLIATGTSTFDEGAKPENLRFVFGTTGGF